jgi:hypothetical protein
VNPTDAALAVPLTATPHRQLHADFSVEPLDLRHVVRYFDQTAAASENAA